jgi:hypothetical protein
MKRRLQVLGLTLAAGGAAAAVAVLLLALLAQPALRLRIDVTSTGHAGVSERSAAALRSLPEDSHLTAFLFPENPAWSWNGSAVYPRAFDRLRSLLEDARLRSEGRLTVQLLDPAAALVEVEEAQRRLERRQGDTLILEAGGRGGPRRVLSFDELFQIVEPSRDGTPARIHAERADHALGSAALTLAAGALPRAAVLIAGRPEALRHPEQLAPLARLLANEGFEIVPVTRLSEAADCDLLVIPGQPQPFSPAEETEVTAWLEAGKPLLLALGSFASDEVANSWNRQLESRGIAFGRGLVCEPVRTSAGTIEGDPMCGNLEILGAKLDEQHPITMRLALSGRASLLAAARPVEIVPAHGNDWTRTRLARSDVNSWVDDPAGTPFTQDPNERRGIRGLAAAVEPWRSRTEGGSGRLLALGSAASLEGPQLPYAQDLVAAGLRWLAGREMRDFELVATRELPFRPTQAEQARIDNLAVLVLPGLTFLLAGWIAWRRRR